MIFALPFNFSAEILNGSQYFNCYFKNEIGFVVATADFIPFAHFSCIFASKS